MTADTEVCRLAVFVPNWVGDAVMCTPALRALRRHWPRATLIGVLRSYLAPLFTGYRWFDAIVFADSFWQAVRQLRQYRPRTAVLFPNSLRSALMGRLGGCRELVGYRRDGRGWLLTQALDWPAQENGRRLPFPMVWAYNRLVGFLGCANPGERMELFTTPGEDAEAAEIWQRYGWQNRSVLALHPGAAYGFAKCWPLDYFVELAQRLAQHDYPVLVLCGPKERALAAAIEQRTCHPAVRGLHREHLHLGLIKSCLRRVALLITTDSGPRHIAVAFDRPVITLFGPTHIAWTETFHAKSLHVQAIVPCGPCQLRQCPLDQRCLRSITPDFVYTQALAWLRRWERPTGQLVSATSKPAPSEVA